MEVKKKVCKLNATDIRYLWGGGWGGIHILRATNWWNTSRMFGSRSCVNSNVSSVELYLST